MKNISKALSMKHGLVLVLFIAVVATPVLWQLRSDSESNSNSDVDTSAESQESREESSEIDSQLDPKETNQDDSESDSPEGATQDSDDDSQIDEIGSSDTTDEGNDSSDLTWEDEYIGLTEEEARELAANQGRQFRVTLRDGEGFPVTPDYRPGRISASVDDGFVVSISVEGESLNDQYNGLTEEEGKDLADEQGRDFRVVSVDGEDFLVTGDFVEGRINAYINDGVITEIDIE